MTEKSKELELKEWFEDFLKDCIDGQYGCANNCENRKECKEYLEQIKRLIQQSGATEVIHHDYQAGVEKGKELAEKPEITDTLLDDIIDAVLENVDCEHTVSRETNIAPLSSAEYSIKSEMIVKEKLRKIFEGAK